MGASGTEGSFGMEAVLKFSIGLKVKAGSGVQPEEYVLYFED
jgi:hypothetical protein